MRIVEVTHGSCVFCRLDGTMKVGSTWDIIVCLSCAGALKAVLPDAPDWDSVSREAVDAIISGCEAIYNLKKQNLVAPIPTPTAQAILEAAQRLVEAAGHLQEET